jgi:Cu-Zn family superoxide dismutase
MSFTRHLVTLGSAVGLLGALTGTTRAGGAIHGYANFVDSSGATIGWARLVEDATGRVHVNILVSGLTPGLHGVHIHAVGACSPTFAAAGGHYNPLGHQHGLDNPSGPHAGDVPNLVVNGAVVGHLDVTTDRVTLSSGPATVFDETPLAVGSAFIIHANPDDQVTDATNGGSGARIACAVIRPN